MCVSQQSLTTVNDVPEHRLQYSSTPFMFSPVSSFQQPFNSLSSSSFCSPTKPTLMVNSVCYCKVSPPQRMKLQREASTQTLWASTRILLFRCACVSIPWPHTHTTTWYVYELPGNPLVVCLDTHTHKCTLSVSQR